MKHRLTAILLAACLVLTAVPAAAAEEQPTLDLPCKAAILIDQDTGTVLYEQNADEQLPIASITKVMTLLLTMEAVDAGKISLTDIVPISAHSYGMGGSQIWLEPGEEFTLDELLKAICVCSANDAAVAVAEFVGGSEPVFVEEMNRRADQLGMAGTHFVNACGLDAEGHLSTARDVSTMSREILNHHPLIQQYTCIWMDSLRGGQTQLLNTNKLLKNYPGTTGLKTGTTGKAGVCVSASASRNGLSLIAVVLGSASGDERWQAATTLLDYGFANYEAAKPALPDGAPATLPVVHGVEESVKLRYDLPETLLLKKGESGTLEASLRLDSEATAPVKAGQQLGTVTLRAGQRTLGEYPICARDAVERLQMGSALARLLESLVDEG